MDAKKIIQLLPYSKPFLFVDELSHISEDEVIGSYTYREDEYFYEGHFKNNPVTPGVILTETLAQIGLVCLGIYLRRNKITNDLDSNIALTSHNIDFYLPVFPGNTVTVKSQKKVFRFNKLICNVQMLDKDENIICRGTISGMIV